MKSQDQKPNYPLDMEILEFPGSIKKDVWCLADAVKGTQIFGGIGSGKTSGSAKTIAQSFLLRGFGGLVLCAKPDEKDNWIQYAKETGRGEDVKVISEENDYCFNFLQYEMNRPDGGGQTRNIANLFMTIYEMGQQGDVKADERFWDNALKRLLNRTIDLLKLSGEALTIENMYKTVSSHLEDTDFYNKFNSGFFKSDDNIEEFRNALEGSFCLNCFIKAIRKIKTREERKKESEKVKLVEDKKILRAIWNYWGRDFPMLADKTRSTIIESFLGLAEPFLTGVLERIFSSKTNISPEETFNGKIIILDFPEKEYLELGVYAQCIFKLIWQQAVQRRKVTSSTIPVFLWIDESHLFLNKYDMMFQTTARSSKACTVFISQNISNYYAVIGGAHPREQTDSLLGNLSTKIFHTNNDHVTNLWAADTLGQDIRSLGGVNVSGNSMMRGYNTSGYQTQQTLMHQVLPIEFTTLKSGGIEHDFLVEAIVTVAGRTWSNERNFMEVVFDQQKNLATEKPKLKKTFTEGTEKTNRNGSYEEVEEDGEVSTLGSSFGKLVNWVNLFFIREPATGKEAYKESK